MSRYDSFAPFYDHVVGPRGEVASLLIRLIKRYRRGARSVLELGCGSGSMLRDLSRQFATTGIDNSAAMLRIARRKAPRATVVLGDIVRFDLARQFDAVLCPFDTINHITRLADWRRVFRNAHRHLKPGGVFIFDVNTEYKMESYRSDPVTADVEADVVSMVQVERLRRFRYVVLLKIFRRERGDVFRLNEMRLPELVVPTSTILKELSVYFKRVTLLDPDRRRPNAHTEELYFVCRDPR
jgi:SAM-dependent methyltransferase